MNAVQTVTATAIVCPNCRTDNTLEATVCVHCSEELPPCTTVTMIEAITKSDELPSTKKLREVPLATAEPARPVVQPTPRERFATQPGAKLCVIRGRKMHGEYPLYEGENLIGRR